MKIIGLKSLKLLKDRFFKNALAISDYITNMGTFKYSCFQIEKGDNCDTVHIQGFIVFKNPMHWTTFKNNFPCSHFNKCISTNTNCRKYCTKEDTRIDGPYESGEFAEERSRTDIKQFLDMVKLGTDDEELQTLFPSLYLREFTKLEKIRNKSIFKDYKTKYRKMEVIYIYGPPRIGKTSYINKLYGYGNYYTVTTYNKGPFDNYTGEKIIVFDEYESQIKISEMNMLIDGHPVQLPCRFENKWACYDKVYIISNSPLNEQYNSDFIKPVQREAFQSRITKIIRFDSQGNMHIEKDKFIDNQIKMVPVEDVDIDEIFLE